jgi:replicative DNA helicase
MKVNELTSQQDAALKSWERFTENRKREWGLYGIDTGIHPLNLLIGGWIPNKVTTIGARSGIGKTALTTQIFKHGSRVQNGKRAEFLFCTWEMESSYLIDRHISHEVGLTGRMLHQGAKLLGDKTMERIKAAYTDAKRLPVWYQEMSTNIDTLTVLIRDFVKTVHEKAKIEGVIIQPVIVIDYIQMAQFEGAGLRTYGIGDFMNGVKKLANDTGATFVIFAQIKRAADDKDMPERNDFADSQSIEMASDNLVLLHRPEYNGIPVIQDPRTGENIDSDGKMLIRVLKGRDFGIGDVLINCDIKFYRFWDITHSMWNFEYWKLYEDQDFWLSHFKLDKVAKTD